MDGAGRWICTVMSVTARAYVRGLETKQRKALVRLAMAGDRVVARAS
jgi:hypothetical protein